MVMPACCVAATTWIHTPAGEVEAGALAIGERVWSLDTAEGRLVVGIVVAIRRATRECVVLRWDDSELICTSDHPLFDPDLGAYRPAGDWVTGGSRRLLRWTEAGPRPTVVTSVETFVGLREVVDLTLAGEPRNFLASGVVAHNKSPVQPGPIAELDGPDLELSTTEPHRKFRVHACAGGQDLEYGRLIVRAESRPIPIVEGGKTLWLSAFIDGQDRVIEDGAVPGSLEVRVDMPPSSCTDGFAVGFMRLDQRADAQLGVSWTIVLETYYDDEVEVSVEPEP